MLEKIEPVLLAVDLRVAERNPERVRPAERPQALIAEQYLRRQPLLVEFRRLDEPMLVPGERQDVARGLRLIVILQPRRKEYEGRDRADRSEHRQETDRL